MRDSRHTDDLEVPDTPERPKRGSLEHRVNAYEQTLDELREEVARLTKTVEEQQNELREAVATMKRLDKAMVGPLIDWYAAEDKRKKEEEARRRDRKEKQRDGKRKKGRREEEEEEDEEKEAAASDESGPVSDDDAPLKKSKHITARPDVFSEGDYVVIKYTTGAKRKPRYLPVRIESCVARNRYRITWMKRADRKALHDRSRFVEDPVEDNSAYHSKTFLCKLQLGVVSVWDGKKVCVFTPESMRPWLDEVA